MVPATSEFGGPSLALDPHGRPRWRGRIHRWAAVLAVPAFAVLIGAASSGTSQVACAVYAVGVTAMLAVSALYHSSAGSPAVRAWLRRLDHSTILLAITGSYTAIVALALSGGPERRLLVAVWIAAAVAVAIRMTWLHAPYPVIALVYLVVGWCALLEWRALMVATTGLDTALLVAGGVLYTVGAVVYALRRPDPWPATFGYHEVFHGLVVAAVLAHYLLVWRLLLR